MCVQAISSGFYQGDYKDIGDVFDLANMGDLSDSTVSQVPAGNPDYPVYGWMLQVPLTTPLYNWSQATGGASSPRNAPRRVIV